MSDDNIIVEDVDTIQTERNRIKRIELACQGSWYGQENRIAQLKARAIDEDITYEQLQMELLAVLRASRPTGPAIHSVPVQPQYGRNITAMPHTGNRLAIQGASLMIHAGYESLAEKAYGGEVCNRAGAHRGMTLADWIRSDLEAHGVSTARMTPPELIAAGFSTTSLPVALGDAVNKSSIALYKEARAAYRTYTAIRRANDFRDHTDIRLSTIETFAKIGKDGELKSTTLGESNTFVWKVDTFARMLRVTRQDVINDSAGVNLFAQIPTAIVRASIRAVSDLVSSTLVANGGSFFHANNGNLLTGGTSPLSSVSLSDAIELLRKQVDERGYELDLMPAVLLVPPELETTARELINSQFIERDVATVGDKLPTGNVHSQAVEPVVESRLSSTRFTGSSTTAWYLFSDAENAAQITAFLGGREAPIVEAIAMDADPQTLGIGWRAYSDFGSVLGDPVAGVKSAGA